MFLDPPATARPTTAAKKMGGSSWGCPVAPGESATFEAWPNRKGWVASHLGMVLGRKGVTWMGTPQHLQEMGCWVKMRNMIYKYLEFLTLMYSRCRLLRRSSAAKSMSRYQLGNGFGSCFFRWVERLWEHKLMLLTCVSKKSCSWKLGLQ